MQILFHFFKIYFYSLRVHSFANTFNPFVPNVPFPYPLKTSENLTVFWRFQGVEKGGTGNKWVKYSDGSLTMEYIIYKNKIDRVDKKKMLQDFWINLVPLDLLDFTTSIIFWIN